MPEPTGLTPASAEDLIDALAFALRHDGKRSYRTAEAMTAKIAAAHLVEHLAKSGFVIMRRPPREAPDASRMLPKR